MGIGLSILLIAVGAVLTFAVEYDIAGVDINVVGWILMGVGVLGLLVTLLVFMPRRRAARRVEERHVYDEPEDPRTRL